jgi:hypothetical protein
MPDPIKPEDLDPEIPKETPEDLLEPEQKEKEPEKPAEKPAEGPTQEQIGAFQIAAQQAVEKATAPPQEPKELDRMGWQTRALQEYPDLADGKSALFQVTLEKIQDLTRQGYRGPDIDHMAAKLAWSDPRVAAGRNAERSREQARDRAAGFERPSPPQRDAAAEKPALSPRQVEHAKKAGITDPDALEGLVDDLRAGARELGR